MFPRSLLAAAAASVVFAPLSASAQPAPEAAPPSNPVSAAPVAAAPALPASPGLVAAGDIVATLKGNPHFTILVKAIDQAQLTAVLSRTPGLTLFAPTDEAFKALPPTQLAKLMSSDNAPILQKILIYHLVNLSLDGAKIKGAKGPVPSVERSTLQIDGSGDTPKVNDADVIQTDVKATNGIVHVVDKVLAPADVTLPAA